ncbi:unnamed protein product [Dracunculus medinensis]|uniref:Plasmodium vivax Vir protein n=1 Tax=Dracunculus medinensis TaxID=318479 RepID=A0A0N4UR02_DRAME|nr:unnamed protein product [Dracunculus medinensis]
MLFMWLILHQLFQFGYFEYEEIEDCSMKVTVNDEEKKRPNIDPSYCYDTNSDLCNALFSKDGDTYTNNLNP